MIFSIKPQIFELKCVFSYFRLKTHITLLLPVYVHSWEQRKLSEICERITRKNRNNESDLPLTIASQFGLIDQRDFFNKIVAAKDMSNYYLLKKGEFAYNKSYSNGFDYGSIKRLNAYKQGCLSTLYICFGITSDEVESDYLECFFDTLKWYGDVSMICAEGARNHGLLNVDTKGFFDEVTVDLPKSLEEQKRISAYLNALNHLITLHQRKYDKLTNVKKSMLEKMFPQNGSNAPEIRFKGFTEAWEQRKVREVTDRYDNLRIPVAASLRVAGTTPYYGANGIQDYVDGYTHDGEFILVAEDGANDLKNYPVKCVKGRIWVNNHAHVLQGKYDCADNQFLAYAISQADIESLLVGGGRAKLNAETLMGIDLLLPNKAEQIRIGKYLAQLDNLITLHQRELEKLKNLKKACLEKMFV